MVVTEPATGVKFADSLTPPGLSEAIFLGAGVREKKIAILNVKVYAAALFVEPTIKETLASFKGKSLEKDDAFFKALAEASEQKTVVIVMVRDIDGATFWNALDEALRPRMGAGSDEALQRFGGLFKDKPLKKHNGIFLTAKGPSLQIASSANATELKPPSTVLDTVESEPLVKALFDVYLGTKPISGPFKKGIAETVAKLL